MWIPSPLFDWLHVSRDAMSSLREEVAGIRGERDALKLQVAHLQVMLDWIRIRVNTLEQERVALIEKAYQIRLPAPELTRKSPEPTPDIQNLSFDDIGDDQAKKYGFPLYGKSS